MAMSAYADLKIGVLALQGAFVEHVKIIRALGAQAREVRLPADLAGLDGLVLPGGESTTIGKLLVEFDLLEPLRAWARGDRPLYGTCAGAILLARDIGGLDQLLIGGLDMSVRRNAFGRQLQSFETDLAVPALGPELFPAVFIRAPAIQQVGPKVNPLARLPDGTIVAAEQGAILVSCFHPELSDDHRFHRYFLDLVRARKSREGLAAGPRSRGERGEGVATGPLARSPGEGEAIAPRAGQGSAVST
jgi:pyridoxal 5'-phosphate synthase pdxT subunit